jgi:hypothetical protein
LLHGTTESGSTSAGTWSVHSYGLPGRSVGPTSSFGPSPLLPSLPLLPVTSVVPTVVLVLGDVDTLVLDDPSVPESNGCDSSSRHPVTHSKPSESSLTELIVIPITPPPKVRAAMPEVPPG